MRTLLSSIIAASVLMSAGAAFAESDRALQALTSGQPEIVTGTAEPSLPSTVATTGTATRIQSLANALVMRQHQAVQHVMDPAGNGAR
jgi:hypothetical protein